MKTLISSLMVILLLPFLSRGEDSAPGQVYRFDFVIQEIDGTRVVNRREYSTLTSEGTNCSIRTSSQVSMSIQPSPGSTQLQTFDLGANIDASHIKETPNGLMAAISVVVTSLPLDEQPNRFPTLRKNVWSGTVAVTVKKPTIIFASDDVTSKHKLEVVLTATPMK